VVDKPWWEDSELQRDVLGTQVDAILAQNPTFAAFRSETHGGIEFLYRQGVILVRDSDVDRVRAVLGDLIGPPEASAEGAATGQGDAPPTGAPNAETASGAADEFVDDNLVAGITALQVKDTIRALEVVDQRLGLGVATPDHVSYVTPAVCCPATEPLNPGQDSPWPPVSDEWNCDGSGVLALVVDTGFIKSLDNPKHRWLAGVTGDEETYNPAEITPYTGHGTFVAGVLRCMAPRATVEVKGFLTGGGAVSESNIIKALYSALELTPDIISMSAGTVTRFNLPSLGFQVLWETRLRYLKGTVLVAAAGNDRDRGPFWPATFPWCVAVGALDMTGHRAGYSNYGSWVDVYALGSDVVNAFPDGVYRYQDPPLQGTTAPFNREMALWSGTSFATPLVSGLIAARCSKTGESGRRAADALLRIARRHARPGVGPILEPGMACLEEWPSCRCRPPCPDCVGA
jgi:hypothetical protein